MNNCGQCGGCSSCAGCGASLTLTPGEIALLQKLGEFAFLPVAGGGDGEMPVYLGDTDFSREEYSLILLCLQKKALISIDYDKPLKGFCYDPSFHRLYRGSIGLTERGQKILEMLDIQGIDP